MLESVELGCYWDVWHAGPTGWSAMAKSWSGETIVEIDGHESRTAAEAELRRLLANRKAATAKAA